MDNPINENSNRDLSPDLEPTYLDNLAKDGDLKSDNQTNNSKPWLFKKGQSGNPAGRPKGKSLKEYSREMLASMTEEERLAFMEGLPKEIIWKMAEGNPHQTTDANLQGEISLKISKEVADKYETDGSPSDNSKEQT